MPSTGAPKLADRLLQPVEADQTHDRGRFAARNDEPVEPVELLGQPYLAHVGSERAQHRHVLAEVALHGKDADRHGVIVGRALCLASG